MRTRGRDAPVEELNVINVARAPARFRAFPDDTRVALKRDKPVACVRPILKLLDGLVIAGLAASTAAEEGPRYIDHVRRALAFVNQRSPAPGAEAFQLVSLPASGQRLKGMHARSMENRLRLAAQRRGLRLEKSHARDPHDLTFGGYMLVNIERNAIAYGVAGHTAGGYGLSLDDVEAYLKRRKEAEQK
jgi:hypothetical protein